MQRLFRVAPQARVRLAIALLLTLPMMVVPSAQASPPARSPRHVGVAAASPAAKPARRVHAPAAKQLRRARTGAVPHTLSITHSAARVVAPPAAAPLSAQDFTLAAPQGFGDRQNSWAWSMKWWQGHLYVGTNRSYQCLTARSLHVFGAATYPPTDVDITCPQNYADLPLQAEIWRWTPPPPPQDPNGVGIWDRVYQSPNTIPNPDPSLTTTSYLPPEAGIRDLKVVTEPDGTQILIASGLSTRSLVGLTADASLGPDLLYTTDGTSWHPIPHDVGTTLGSVPGTSYRGIVQIGTRIFVIATNLEGAGPVYAADWADPACSPLQGNNCWYQVSSTNTPISEIASYNGFLYLTAKNDAAGYSVLKADPTQPLTSTANTWAFKTVVPTGAGLAAHFSNDSWAMHVYTPTSLLGTTTPGWLFVGGDGTATHTGAELLRLDPYDNWDIVHGSIRATPANPDIPGQRSPLSGLDGTMYPLSGLDSGFDTTFNQHMWRMETNSDPTTGDGQLYVGTFDLSTDLKSVGSVRSKAQKTMGFDLWRTSDGWTFTNVTSNGFFDMYNFGARSMQSTPYGFFVGTANYYYGLKVYRSLPAQEVVSAPQDLQVVQACGAAPALSWKAGPVGAGLNPPVQYIIRRSLVSQLPPIGTPQGPFVGTYAQADTRIAAVAAPTDGFLDSAATGWRAGYTYHYTVVAVDAQGNRSQQSNVVRSPSLGALITADATTSSGLPQVGVLQVADAWAQQGRVLAPETYTATLRTPLQNISASLASKDVAGAATQIDALRNQVAGGTLLEPLATADLLTLLDKLEVELVSVLRAGATACPPPATQTPTALPTLTPTPTETSTAPPSSTAATATPVPSATSSPVPATPVQVAGCTATLTTSAAINGSSVPTYTLQAQVWQDHPTIVVNGAGFLPNESVQVYFNGAVPFGDPGEGSFAAPTSADATGSLLAVPLTVNALPAPNTDYAITAVGNKGSCATIEGIVVPTTIGVPIFPVYPTFLAPTGATISGATLTVPVITQTVLISSSRIMSNATSLSAFIDTASQNNFSAVPNVSPFPTLFNWTQLTPLSVTVTPRLDLSGPTWGAFELSGLPSVLSFNVHSIILAGTNQTAVSNVYVSPQTSRITTFLLRQGLTQYDAIGVRYRQVTPATVSADPNSGPPLSPVTVSGGGFARNVPLTVTFFSGTSVVTPTDSLPVMSSISGTVSYTFQVPASAAVGAATIVVVDPARTKAFAPFTIPSPPTPTVPPTATSTTTPLPPTPTSTSTAVPPTATSTTTPLPPSATNTSVPVPPSATNTSAPVPPTATSTTTSLPPSATNTSAPVPPTATATSGLVPTATAITTPSSQLTVPSASPTVVVSATATATAMASSAPVLQVYHKPLIVLGGRTQPCDMRSNLKHLSAGCEIISSVSAPGAQVTYTIAYPKLKGKKQLVQIFQDRADSRGHSLHIFNVAYLPPPGVKPGSSATLALAVVAVTLPTHATNVPARKVKPVSFIFVIIRLPSAPVLQVYHKPLIVLGGRTQPCDMRSNLKHLSAGCEIISSVSAPGAQVTYTIAYPKLKGKKQLVQIFQDRADSRGHSLHIFNVAYLPPPGVKPGSSATLAQVTVTAALATQAKNALASKAAPVAFSFVVVR